MKVAALKWRISDSFFTLRELPFSSIWTVQPQSDCQTLAGQSRSRKMKISLSANEFRLSDSPLLSNYFPAAWNYYSYLHVYLAIHFCNIFLLTCLFGTSRLFGTLDTPIYSQILEEKKVQEINTTCLFHIPFKLSNEPKTKKIQRTNFEKIQFQAFSFIKQNPIWEAKLLTKYL